MARTTTCVLAFLAGVTAGCYSDEDNFAERAAKLYCVRMEECNKSAFEDQYDGEMDDCRDDREDQIQNWLGVAHDLGCEYEADEGRDCIHAAYKNRHECGENADDDISDECDRVYDCN